MMNNFDIIRNRSEENRIVNLKRDYDRKKRIWGALSFVAGIILTFLVLTGGIYWWLKNSDGYLTLFNYSKSKVVVVPELNEGALPEPEVEEELDSEGDFSEEPISQFQLEIATDDLKIEAPIIEGADKENLSQGVGHHKTTARPGFSGNVVIYGHRWYPGDNPYYTIFNDLDRLKAGDRVTVLYNGQKFSYEIFDSKVVLEEQTEILKQTEEPILTLYTCTPRYTSEKRLVYLGKLVAWSEAE